MRHWKVLLLALVAVTLPNCSQTESDLQVTVSPSRTYVINASAKSCITKKTEDSTNPSPNDVGAAFFQV
ncbi:hypothetical protein [Bdellovibrio bacteriovorus]|uniref:Uncharacterized protein n=1 Tax=Bdellovibrio bacteriovorus str. Tiberius TaxID=1069642 RepID=K7ZEJ4_BDEBC|nr:hypothetical protein [Bdellovibrio bacteriovorus]AFY00532.1 hypothetical protein Bdt_0826 [Bdellovibrio bacteriovorus str. Tiberius]